jgi:hypothetical protein
MTARIDLDAYVVSKAIEPTELGAIVDLIAERVCERVLDALSRYAAPARSDGLVDAQTLAGVLGVDRAYVYRHRDELGAIKVGDGERPRLRFDLAAALGSRDASGISDPHSSPPLQADRSRRSRLSGSGVDLLPVGRRKRGR